MYKSLAHAAFGLALTAGSTAFAAAPDPHTNIPSFTTDNLVNVAQLLQYQAEVLSDGQGNKAVGIVATNGIKFIAQPSACQKPNQGECLGLSVFGMFTDASGAAPSLDTLNKFNIYRSFTKAYADGPNVFLTRYEISDYGIPIGNIASNMTNFAGVAATFSEFLKAGGASVSNETGVDAQANGLGGLGGTGFMPGTPTTGKPDFKLTAQQQKYVNTIEH